MPLSQLRLLTVTHWGFDGEVRSGQLVVAREYADDLLRVVHGDQEYVWHRPVVVGETLEVRSRIAAIRERGGNGFLTIEVTLWDARGEPVATTRATMIERAAE